MLIKAGSSVALFKVPRIEAPVDKRIGLVLRRSEVSYAAGLRMAEWW